MGPRFHGNWEGLCGLLDEILDCVERLLESLPVPVPSVGAVIVVEPESPAQSGGTDLEGPVPLSDLWVYLGGFDQPPIQLTCFGA